MKYTPTMGLEIHAELLTKTKVFCRCKNEFGGEKNSRVCPVCLGLPGAMPVLNREAVTLAVRAGLALGCRINEYSAFSRKNYFYPDLPKAYQITQFEYPICEAGEVELGENTIRINRIHIEEDAGKLLHGEKTEIDFNRCGVPLIEIVTEPDFQSIDEVIEFVDAVSLSLKYAGVCDGRLEQGSFRVDVNISIKPEGSEQLGTRAEIKNLNSRKSIRRALAYEIKRQAAILEKGDKVIQETRRFNEQSGETAALRGKEGAEDYRYFPEPDLPPVRISAAEVEKIRAALPKLPNERFRLYTDELGLSVDDAHLILGDMAFADFFEAAAVKSPKTVAKLMLGELNHNLNNSGKEICELPFAPADLAELADLEDRGRVSKSAAREILKLMFEVGGKPAEIAEAEALFLEDNSRELAEIAAAVLAENEGNITDYLNGNQKLFSFFMGEVMRRAGRGANPALARAELLKALEQKNS